MTKSCKKIVNYWYNSIQKRLEEVIKVIRGYVLTAHSVWNKGYGKQRIAENVSVEYPNQNTFINCFKKGFLKVLWRMQVYKEMLLSILFQ